MSTHSPPPVVVEACVDSVASAVAARRGGATRLELCAALADAGTTPSAGMIAAVRERVPLALHVLVRPRGGSFTHSRSELDVMRRDVEAAVALGVEGVVVGVLTPERRVDAPATRRLVEAAGGRAVTFHRAIDLVSDLADAAESLVAAGVTRVLTAGGAPTALAGAASIARLVAHAAGRFGVIAGGGITAADVPALLRRTAVRELHLRAARLVRPPGLARPSTLALRRPLPPDEESWEETDAERVRAVVRAARAAGAAGA